MIDLLSSIRGRFHKELRLILTANQSYSDGKVMVILRWIVLLCEIGPEISGNGSIIKISHSSESSTRLSLVLILHITVHNAETQYCIQNL